MTFSNRYLLIGGLLMLLNENDVTGRIRRRHRYLRSLIVTNFDVMEHFRGYNKQIKVWHLQVQNLRV